MVLEVVVKHRPPLEFVETVLEILVKLQASIVELRARDGDLADADDNLAGEIESLRSRFLGELTDGEAI